ncbi:GNAT family N-acetyltransferase [Methylobacillus gramineus]|uniref:GNAT family N-acetyltransferase n=1 Tax=Methylobacillus gramineus TaxID=755169 RepID=UPI001CFF9900|nr:GNAT family protein [Methylobacillus gramineus]MCB5184217.1 GNAT family N-acetyltransferase [Methylobacillus gramineus]
MNFNNYGQPVGPDLSDWHTRPLPPHVELAGHYCRLEPVSQRHAESLFAAYQLADDHRDWTYIAVGPFDALTSFEQYVLELEASSDPLHYAVIDLETERAIGTLSLMRIDPKNGVVEVGFVVYSPLLQKSRIATEAQFLLMRHVFDDLGYRRYEWKCDDLNAPSRAAALRLGFRFEGVFRQAVVYKGRSRDTAWFSIIDQEWPALREVYLRWLAPDNFDKAGQQIVRLSEWVQAIQTF